MAERTSYEAGRPCWVEYSAADLEASIRFYGDLFGWDVPEPENAEQTGGYRLALLDGRPVAGVTPKMQEEQPTVWTTYVSVDDADATAAAVSDAGGTVVVEPMEVMDLGKMAVFTDSGGAVFGVWQPGTFHGAEVLSEPRAMTWNELTTRDPGAAKSFYGSVFGWDFEDKEFERGAYTIVSVGGEAFGGVTDRAPEGFPAHWLVYFAVEDADATVATAKKGGGEAMVGPFDISEVGRIAVIEDPGGAFFAIIQPDPQMRADDPGRR
jgi:predicted enzyme related to lactoylglutathione lyase